MFQLFNSGYSIHLYNTVVCFGDYSGHLGHAVPGTAQLERLEVARLAKPRMFTM